MTDKVTVDIEGAVRTVTLNRPEKSNALDTEMLVALEEAFDPSPGPGSEERVAVIRSVGRVFCSGHDLSGGAGALRNIEVLFTRVQHWPLPVVAVVQGAAIAGGNELAADLMGGKGTKRQALATRHNRRQQSICGSRHQ